jgi:hypothetical protein
MVMMGELPGDRTGRASFSSVRVMFALANVQEKFHWDMPLFCQQAVRAVNHFLVHYRVITDRPWVGPVTMSLIQEFHLVTEFEDGTTQQQEYGSGSGPLNGFGGAIPDDVDGQLRKAVAAAAPPTIQSTLDVNIRDCLDLQEWRLALIEAAVLFEAWLYKFVRERYTKNGMAVPIIDRKFRRPDGSPKSITSVAKTLVRDATGFNFGDTAEYGRWETTVRNPRNDLVHGKRFDVSPKEAHDAYSAVTEAIGLLARN